MGPRGQQLLHLAIGCQTAILALENFLGCNLMMSTEPRTDAPIVNPSAGAASGDREAGVEEFSPEQLALIDRLITARVAAATAGSVGQADASSTPTTVETGKFFSPSFGPIS